MWTIYIGRNNSLLKINNLHFKNKKNKMSKRRKSGRTADF